MSANSRSYQIYRLLDHLLGGEVPAQRFHRGRSEASVREIEMHMSSQKQKPVKEIPRVRNISDDDFQSEYVKRGLPVVLHGKAKD